MRRLKRVGRRSGKILYSLSSVFGCVPTRPTSTPSPAGRYPPVFHHALTYLPLHDLPLNQSIFERGRRMERGNETDLHEVASEVVASPDTITQSLITALSSLHQREGEIPSPSPITPSSLRTLMQWLATLAPRRDPPSNSTLTATTTATPSTTTDALEDELTNTTTVTTTTTTVIPGMTTTTVTPTTTTTTAPTTTTTVAPTDCCPALTQTLTSSEFPDGVMAFTYNSNACRSTVSAFCTQTDPAFNLYAAIVANRMDFLDYQPTSVTFPGTCIGGTWFMGTPPLAIVTIECRLTNPPTTP